MPKILDAPKLQNFAARRKKGMVIQMDYTTQMDAARKGILTGQLRAVAVEEKNGGRTAARAGCEGAGGDPRE